MLSTILSIFVFLISINSAFAQSLLTGQFTGLGGDTENFKYSQCQAGEAITIVESVDGLVVEGLLKHGELSFPRINLEATGHPAPILNYSQRRTIETKDSEGHVKVSSQVRSCVGLLGDAGCLGRPWKTTAWLEFIPYGNEQIMLLAGYKPFAQSPIEVCAFVKN